MDQSRTSDSRNTPGSGASRSGSASERSRAPEQAPRGDGADSGGNGPSQETLSQVQDEAGKLVGAAREQAMAQLSTQKGRAASNLGSLATALHDASSEMRKQDDAMVAGYVDSAAGQLDRVAGMLRDQDIDEILAATGRFARREPALFLAAAFALGFAGARFLRSSPRITSLQTRPSQLPAVRSQAGYPHGVVESYSGMPYGRGESNTPSRFAGTGAETGAGGQ